MSQDAILLKKSLTTPHAAAIAGILFSILLIISLTIIRVFVPSDPQDVEGWLSENWKLISLAQNLAPFAGIAFFGSSAWCAIAWERMKIAYLPPCSWAVGSCFLPHCSSQRQLQAAF